MARRLLGQSYDRIHFNKKCRQELLVRRLGMLRTPKSSDQQDCTPIILQVLILFSGLRHLRLSNDSTDRNRQESAVILVHENKLEKVLKIIVTMLELAMTKKGWSDNIRSRSKSRERVALLGNHSNNQRNNVTTPSSSGNGSGRFGLRGRESRRRNRTDEEKVSLLGKSPGKIKKGSRRRKGAMRAPFTMSRMMKYIMVLLLSALVSFKLLRKEASNVGVINWDMHDKILRPKKGNEGKCVGESKDKLDAQCACANPWEAVANDDASRWKSNHDHMVHQANNAPQNLDIVFFGDGMVEQLSGTRDLGKEMVDGMESYFEKTFQRKTGGKYNAIALGSSGDTVCFADCSV